MAPLSPMMQQYMQIKDAHRDAILFYRLGDFYEMFYDDAEIASKELDLTLTGRDCGQEERAPMCGVPFHSSEAYVAKLVEKGHKVAICEQVEDPATSKGIVKRQVVRIVTPGTLIENTMLDEGKNNYIVSLFLCGNTVGLAFADSSTGEICAGENAVTNVTDFVVAEMARLSPAEVLMTEEFKGLPEVLSCAADKLHAACEFIDGKPDPGIILRHFNRENFEALGLDGKEAAVGALANLLAYLYATQMSGLETLRSLRHYDNAGFMKLDQNTRRNLEITKTMRTGEVHGSLLGVVDRTRTAMGKRLLRSWLERPLLDPASIIRRQNAVAELVDRSDVRNGIRSVLDGMLDAERLMARIVYGSANARDLIALRNIIYRLPKLKEYMRECTGSLLTSLNGEINTLDDVFDKLSAAIKDDPPTTVREGGMIKNGYNSELDELREIVSSGKNVVTRIEEEEKAATGIKNLRVGYNRVFGYYIEVSKLNTDKVPDTYIRKQTLTNAERYITEHLKEWESKILGAQERITALEYELFSEVRGYVADRLAVIQSTTGGIAAVDVLCSMAEVSARNRYCMPEVIPDGVIDIKGGRHPVVEDINRDVPFVPNDTFLDSSANRTMIITGPNMAGKSTYMRQTALIVLMAQVGMFVPANSAHVGIIDSIFTRVGASDDLAGGDSTFMVEMKEVAYILNHATDKSLIIFDEIGRGTSTFDGMSIARATIEYVNAKIRAKSLFATHYHELTELENQSEGIKNYNISVKKKGEDVIFLRKLLRGGADQSLGIEIAKLAGAPEKMVRRARNILSCLKETEMAAVKAYSPSSEPVPEEPEKEENELLKSEVMAKLSEIDTDTLSPIEAMNILYKLCKTVQGK